MDQSRGLRRVQGWVVGRFARRRTRLAVLFAAGAVLGACGLYGVEPPTLRSGSPGQGGKDDEVGQAVLHITAVPEDVLCVRITAAGPGRSVVKELDASGDAAISQNLTGLPLGTVVFAGEAFAAACSSVGKATIAGWASESVETSIVLGRLANVNLVMARNGRAKVDVSFRDEAACTALGAACRLASECCSKRCQGGVCSNPDAGAPARD